MKRTTTLARFCALWGGIGALSCAAIVLAADRGQTSSATSPTAVPKSSKGRMTVDATLNEGGIAGGVLYTSNTYGGSFYSPGAGATGPVYTFDDVPMSDIVLNGASAVKVTKVTVGIFRTATAVATNVNVYRATLTTNVMAPDTNLDVPPTLIGSVSLPASTVAGVVPVTIGDGTTPLFTHPLNRDVITGGNGEALGSLAIGVQTSVAGGGNGWALTTGGDPNVNAFWQWNPGGSPPENYYWFGPPPANPVSQFYIELEGIPLFACAADITHDNVVDVNDLLSVITTWGPCGGCPPVTCPADVAPAGGDCQINVNDLLAVITTWGACSPPVGACCDSAGVAPCVQSQAGACATAGDLWRGAGTTCASVTCPQVPPNDECATAAPITIGTVAADLTLANTSAQPPGAGCQPISHDIWYSMATTPGTSYTVDTLLSDPGLDTVIELYDSTGGCAALAIQNCCDDTGGVGTTTSCTFLAVPTTSKFRIGMWDVTPGGPITVRVSSP